MAPIRWFYLSTGQHTIRGDKKNCNTLSQRKASRIPLKKMLHSISHDSGYAWCKGIRKLNGICDNQVPKPVGAHHGDNFLLTRPWLPCPEYHVYWYFEGVDLGFEPSSHTSASICSLRLERIRKKFHSSHHVQRPRTATLKMSGEWCKGRLRPINTRIDVSIKK